MLVCWRSSCVPCFGSGPVWHPENMIELPDHLELTDEQARVLGVLMEKQATTPDVYPMTLRSVTTGCNQSTSRSPLVDYDDTVVERALEELKAAGLVRMVHPGAGERSTKYRHVVDEVLGLDRAGCAILCVLLLRGPQTAAEVRSRTDRIHSFPSTEATEQALNSLADHPRRLADQLERVPGQKERRWVQLLTASPAGPAGVTPDVVPPSLTDTSDAERAAPATVATGDLASRLAAVEVRLGQLERIVAHLSGGAPDGEANQTDGTW